MFSRLHEIARPNIRHATEIGEALRGQAVGTFGVMPGDLDDLALVVVDVQRGVDDPWWGPRNNLAATRTSALW